MLGTDINKVLNSWTFLELNALGIAIEDKDRDTIAEFMEPHIWELGLYHFDDTYEITDNDIDEFIEGFEVYCIKTGKSSIKEHDIYEVLNFGKIDSFYGSKDKIIGEHVILWGGRWVGGWWCGSAIFLDVENRPKYRVRRMQVRKCT